MKNKKIIVSKQRSREEKLYPKQNSRQSYSLRPQKASEVFIDKSEPYWKFEKRKSK